MQHVNEMYETTDLSIQQIAEIVQIPFWKVFDYIKNTYPTSIRNLRKRRIYSLSKIGEKNPQFGLTGEKSFRFQETVSDGKGYLMVLKPDWYTGRKGTKHVFQHHIVVCEALGLTEIPKGFCVHHIDEDKTNNLIVNLALLTTSAHMRLHQLERATTREKSRRVKVDSKRGEEVALGASCDIV